MSKPKYLYFIILRKDDSIVAVGTARECMKIMGLASMNSFRSIVSKNRLEKYSTYEIDIEPIEDDEE